MTQQPEQSPSPSPHRSAVVRKGERFNPSRVWLDREIAAFAAAVPARTYVLDAGAGDQRYKAHFAHCTYESADFGRVNKHYAESTYVCDLADIPVDSGRYHGIVFSQVMEHLPEPIAVLKELRRILRPDGRLFYSGPLWYEEHELPFDFYRYTQFGLRYLFEKAGLVVEEMRWLEGYLGTLTHQFNRMLNYLPEDAGEIGGSPEAEQLIYAFQTLRPLAAKIAKLAAACDVDVRYTKSGFPINYVAVLRSQAD